MKSFTVTFHHTQNYGATLQAYALQQYLMKQGIENEIMEYSDQTSEVKQRSLKQLLVNFVFKVLQFLRRKELSKAKSAFREFHDKYMHFSRTYVDIDDIKRDPPKADIYITGSDQVWNLKTTPNFIPARFLDFGDENTTRFSYAASIGRLNYTDNEKKAIRRYLSSYKGISLREKTAAVYMSEIVGKECFAVADPVFLLGKEEWRKIEAPREVVEGKFILCYFVQGNDRIGEIVTKVREETGYKVVAINCGFFNRVKADAQLYDVSPQEFLYLYDKASIVVTTSFHGTAFALVYGKPVYSLIRDDWDTRISDLLDEVGLSECAISRSSEVKKVNYDIQESQIRLKKYIDSSVKFLGDMLHEQKVHY